MDGTVDAEDDAPRLARELQRVRRRGALDVQLDTVVRVVERDERLGPPTKRRDRRRRRRGLGRRARRGLWCGPTTRCVSFALATNSIGR